MDLLILNINRAVHTGLKHEIIILNVCLRTKFPKIADAGKSLTAD